MTSACVVSSSKNAIRTIDLLKHSVNLFYFVGRCMCFPLLSRSTNKTEVSGGLRAIKTSAFAYDGATQSYSTLRSDVISGSKFHHSRAISRLAWSVTRERELKHGNEAHTVHETSVSPSLRVTMASHTRDTRERARLVVNIYARHRQF